MKKIIVLMLACVLVLSLAGCGNSDYDLAVSLYEDGKYMEAEQLFAALGDHKDSIKLRLACRYGQAMELYKSNEYAEAEKLFEKLGNYEDSPEMLNACRYAQALAYQAAGEYEAAMAQYSQLPGYEDSASKIIECRKLFVAEMMDSKQYAKALPHLKALKKANALDSNSNAVGWCTLAAFLQENRGFSNVQGYAFSILLTEDEAIEVRAHLAEVDESNIKNNEVSTIVLDYSVKIGYNAAQAETSYSYARNTEKKVGTQTRTGWGTENATATIPLNEFTAKEVNWENLQYEGVDINKRKVSEPYNAMSALTLETIYRELNLALAETGLEITLRDLGFISLAV